ncbi:MAG: tetratricopeptide repeat protein [Gammaproteobacteria bacterium]|nr:tetratricopeptide repeat protein [Gammaproteobacteria bacterium]
MVNQKRKILEMHICPLVFLRAVVATGLLAGVLFSAACSSLAPQAEETVEPEAKGVTLDEDLLYELLAAEFAGNAGDFDTSVDFYQQAAVETDDSRVAARATYIALYAKQYERTLELLTRWRELEPENQDIDRIYASSYLHLHQPEKALPYVLAVLAHHTGKKEKAMVVNQLLNDEVDAQDSHDLLNALNQKQADNVQMLILQSKFAAQLEQYDQSIMLLDRALKIDSSLLEVYLIKARIYQTQGKTAESKAVIEQVLSDYPENVALRLQYAQMLVGDKDYEGAREQYILLQKKQPDNVEVLLNLSLLYIETEQLDEAAELLSHLVELDQKTDIAHYYLGRIQQNKQQFKSAIAHYIKVKNGNYVFEARLRIASLFARLDRVDEAIEQLEVLAEETEDWPNRVRTYLAQGEIFRSRQRYQDAFDMYSRALSYDSEDINLLYARALIAEKIDRVDVAESDLLKVLAMEPENSDALNALGYTLADKTKRYQEAKEYIQKAAALVPDDPAVMDSLGWVNYRLGELQEALKWLSMAFEKLQDAEIAAHYGEVLWQSNQKDKAREIWEKGQKVDAQHPVLVETLKRFNP